MNIRRKLRPKSSKFSSFVDFEHDFVAEEDYLGPTLPEDLSAKVEGPIRTQGNDNLELSRQWEP